MGVTRRSKAVPDLIDTTFCAARILAKPKQGDRTHV